MSLTEEAPRKLQVLHDNEYQLKGGGRGDVVMEIM